MGSWGVRSHESDYGLDLLGVAEDSYLRAAKFKRFHVKHITELLRAYIVGEFVKESAGWESHYIDYFYDYTFPYRFADAVVLVAECFAEYRQKGSYLIYDHESAKEQRISVFIFTVKDLEALLTELQAVLEPKHGMYKSWENSASFDKWRVHIQMLCDTISQAISEGGDSHA